MTKHQRHVAAQQRRVRERSRKTGRSTQDTCVDVGSLAGFFLGVCTALMHLPSRENFKLWSPVVVAAFGALVARFVCVLSDRANPTARSKPLSLERLFRKFN